MLAGVSEMRVSDARFTSTYDKNNPGLAQFWHDAQCHTRVLKWRETTHNAFLASSSSS
ncbi:MAG: TipAS antibiotic-recognition domain-containing protein [Candidatus Cryosericum sp.]